jgi:retron-type reverse transcriptase
MGMRCDDDKLKKHTEKSVGSGMYLSPVVINELIDICEKMIQANMVKRVKEKVCCSVLAERLA